MIEVRIITTEGCEGCRIMNKICTSAATQINESRKVNDVVVIDFDFREEAVRQFVNRYQVKDYPATFILKDNKVVDRIFGTCTKQMMINTLTKYIG